MKYSMEEPAYLKSMGFSKAEIKDYERLVTAGAGSEKERLRMIGEKRKHVLDTIHKMEEQIIQMDFLRNEIRESE